MVNSLTADGSMKRERKKDRKFQHNTNEWNENKTKKKWKKEN